MGAVMIPISPDAMLSGDPHLGRLDEFAGPVFEFFGGLHTDLLQRLAGLGTDFLLPGDDLPPKVTPTHIIVFEHFACPALCL